MIICAFTMHGVPIWDISPDATHLAGIPSPPRNIVYEYSDNEDEENF
jgi:hypothetical protein